MILCVSPNIALDRVYVVRGFAAGRQCRTLLDFVQAGGSGVHASSVIRTLGGETLAMGFTGGARGHQWAEAAAGLGWFMVAVQGETRESLCVIDVDQGSVVESIEPGPTLSTADLDRLLENLGTYLPSTNLLILSGSLPPGIPADAYAQMIALAHQHAVPVIADIHSEPLAQAIPAKPWLIKPNVTELHRLIGRDTGSLHERMETCRYLCRETGIVVLLSMEEEGALLTSPEGQWHFKPPVVPMRLPDGEGINVIGCGDALVGAFAYQFARNGDVIGAARLGLAAAHYNLSTYGVPEIDAESVRALAQQVVVSEAVG